MKKEGSPMRHILRRANHWPRLTAAAVATGALLLTASVALAITPR